MNADNLEIRLLRYRSRRVEARGSAREQNDESPHALAASLLDAGRPGEALEVIRLARADQVADVRMLVLEGRAWFDQGDLAEAQAAWMRAAKADPRNKEPYRWLAQVLMKRGEPARAVQVLERALQIDPSDKALQQVHMRAQRLARIASDTELTGEATEVRGHAAAPPSSGARHASEPPTRAVMLARPKSTPVDARGPNRELPADLRFVLDRQPENAPDARRRVPAEFGSRADPRASTPLPAVVTPDAVDDSPTAAFEMPAEIRDWLEAERANDMATLPPAQAPSEPIASPVLELTKPRGSESGSGDFSRDFARAHAEAEAAAPQAEAREQNDAGGLAPSAEAEAPEQVLDLLARQGMFETQRLAPGAGWASKAEAPRAGNRVGKALAVSWALALLSAAGGYYGWTQWLGARRADARALIAKAVTEAQDGQNASLLSAERHLGEARALDPKSSEALEQLLFVHATRALEDGSGDIGYLRSTLARAESGGVSPALIAAAKALVRAVDRNAPEVQAEAERALKSGADDARVLYLVGRLFQRSGRPEARELLARASQRDGSLALAWSAQAELALAAAERETGLALLQKALGSDGQFLRAELWRAVIEASPEQALAIKGRLDGLAERVRAGSASDQLLAIIARCRVQRLLGQPEQARAELDGAQKLTVLDPELMSLLGQEAFAVGAYDLAYRAANAAVAAAPGVQRYRANLVDALLARGDGRGALRSLEAWQAEGHEPDAAARRWALLSRARAALLAGTRDALAETKKALAAYRASAAGGDARGHAKDDVEASALLLRADLKLGANAESLLPAARTLAQQQPHSAAAQLALGEAALLSGQGAVALGALDRVLGADAHGVEARGSAREQIEAYSSAADAYYLRGRSQRLLGKPDLAKADFLRALSLAPVHEPAREALGGLLIDAGQYAEASVVFGQLEQDGAGTSAALGSIEALLGDGELAAAEARLGRLSESERALPAAVLLSARLALAEGARGAREQNAAALKQLEPLVAKDAETRTAEVLTLYGQALYANDKVDSAAGAFEDALELDPAYPDALVGRAMAAVRAEKPKEAKGYLEAALKALDARVRPPRLRAELLLTWAKADVLEHDYAAAQPRLIQAVALAGVPAEAYFWLGECLTKTKALGASERYAKYLELDPNGAYAARAKRALAPR
jgi:tetratricopeptide (TPR) repeat protein